ncbi:unnamed protein product [Closterium sp. Yama58-4]|nr:unnamed protein product [Closterium sp. Yama58-4]
MAPRTRSRAPSKRHYADRVELDGEEFAVGHCVYVKITSGDSSNGALEAAADGSDSDESDASDEECQICGKAGGEGGGGTRGSKHGKVGKAGTAGKGRMAGKVGTVGEGGKKQKRRRTARERVFNGELAIGRIERIWRVDESKERGSRRDEEEEGEGGEKGGEEGEGEGEGEGKGEGAAEAEGGESGWWCRVRWYVLPEETVEGRQARHRKREVFYGDVTQEIEMVTILRACQVLPEPLFAAAAHEGDDVFLCRMAYDSRSLTFKRLPARMRVLGGGGPAGAAGGMRGEGEMRGMAGGGGGGTGAQGRGGNGGGKRRRGERDEGNRKGLHGSGEDGEGSGGSDGSDSAIRGAPQGILQSWWERERMREMIRGTRGMGKAAEEEEDEEEEEEEEDGEREESERHVRKDGEQKGRKVGGLAAVRRAKRALQLSRVPPCLPCREKEQQEVEGFVARVVGGHGSREGTGKTAVVVEVMRQARRSSREGLLLPFQFVHINALHLPAPTIFFSVLWEALTGQRVAWKKALHSLNVRFASPRPSSPPGGVLYNIFEWTTWSSARLAVIGIANTVDLPERLLPRIASRMGLHRVPFAPYTRHQVETIVAARLHACELFAPRAIELAARKVASVSGDVRRALEICRRAVEIAEAEARLAGTSHAPEAGCADVAGAADVPDEAEAGAGSGDGMGTGSEAGFGAMAGAGLRLVHDASLVRESAVRFGGGVESGLSVLKGVPRGEESARGAAGEVTREIEEGLRGRAEGVEERKEEGEASAVEVQVRTAQQSPLVVQIEHVEAAIRDIFSSPHIMIIRHLSAVEKIFLAALSFDLHQSGASQSTFARVHQLCHDWLQHHNSTIAATPSPAALSSLAASTSASPPDQSEAAGGRGEKRLVQQPGRKEEASWELPVRLNVSHDALLAACARLAESHLLLAEGTALHCIQRIQLNLPREDVLHALSADQELPWLARHLG